MGNFKDEERLKALRERLYARGKSPDKRPVYTLEDNPKDVSTVWQKPPRKVEIPKVPPKTESFETKQGDATAQDNTPMAGKKRSKKYRLYIVLAGMFFFVLSVGISSLLFMVGSNTISGENIALSLSNGPFTIGGGETLSLQAGITNQNAVPIESATLIVTYPLGTLSATEEGKELFIERLPLDTIEPGETLNIPLRAVVFGEENQEKEITAELEYRVAGSNSTFSKGAEPYQFKISSSPVFMTVDALDKVASGQEIDIRLRVTSNSQNTLTDIVVRADYPEGFDFTRSEPEPVSGQNVWFIESLEPSASVDIDIQGVVVGDETDAYALLFSIGVPNQNDRYTLASVFSTATTEFTIEQPFIGVTLDVNGDDSGTVAVEADDLVEIVVELENTLPYTLYDNRVTLTLSGNALSDYEVRAGNGFYESQNNIVRWDGSLVDRLNEMNPGQSLKLQMSLKPDPDIDITPQLAFNVDVRGRRFPEGNVAEELIGTAASVAKVSSVVAIESEVGRDTSTFTDTGSIPPKAEEETTYTITLFTQNGTNDIVDAEIVASLPNYVTWLGNTSGAGNVTYNEVSRAVTWNIGSVDANQSKIASFQVSLLPSKSQIGTTPTLISEQRLRATDSFTGVVVRTTSPSLSTRLSTEAGYTAESGEVVE